MIVLTTKGRCHEDQCCQSEGSFILSAPAELRCASPPVTSNKPTPRTDELLADSMFRVQDLRFRWAIR